MSLLELLITAKKLYKKGDKLTNGLVTSSLFRVFRVFRVLRVLKLLRLLRVLKLLRALRVLRVFRVFRVLTHGMVAHPSTNGFEHW